MPGQKSPKELTLVKYSEKAPQTLIKYSKIAMFSTEKTHFFSNPWKIFRIHVRSLACTLPRHSRHVIKLFSLICPISSSLRTKLPCNHPPIGQPPPHPPCYPDLPHEAEPTPICGFWLAFFLATPDCPLAVNASIFFLSNTEPRPTNDQEPPLNQ